jgi:dsRNA-specific ribonuclease/signal transduction histidine kinase
VQAPPAVPAFLETHLPQEVELDLGAGEEPQQQAWIRAALTDASYIRDAAPKDEAAVIALEALAMVGAAGIKLALLQCAFEQGLSARNANDYLQRLRRPSTSAVCARFGLMDAVVVAPSFAKDLKQEPVRRRVEMEVVHRFAGALCLSDRYEDVLGAVREAAPAFEEAGPPVASYKTELQEYFAPRGQGPASYHEIEASGPPHDRRFIVEVRLPDGRSAQGHGRTKKEAGEHAARAFLEAHAARHLEARKRLTKQPSRPRPPRTFHHVDALDRLAVPFGVDPAHLAELSVALTHPDAREGELVADRRRSLAQLGAVLMELIVGQLLFEELPRRDSTELVKAELLLGRIREGATSARAFDLLGLERALIRPPDLALTERVRSDAFQAVIATGFLSRGKPTPDLLPTAAKDYFRERVREAFGTPREHLFDAKTALQQRLAALRMKWQYDVEADGPPHARTFTSRLSLQPPIGDEVVTIRGGEGGSRREADKALAVRVLRLLDLVNEGIGTTDAADEWDDQLRRMAAFLLMSEARSVATSGDALALTRLVNAGILGAPLLTTGRADEFRRWADTAGHLLDESGYAIDRGALAGYYRHLKTLAGEASPFSLAQSVSRIADRIELLSPEGYDHDLRDTEEFRELLSLATVARLSIQPVEARPLTDLVDEIVLLRRGRRPTISLEGNIPDALIALPAGSLQMVVADFIEVAPAAEGAVVSVEPGEHGDSGLRVEISPIPVDIRSRIEELRRSALWSFLAPRVGSLVAEQDGSLIRLTVTLLAPPAGEKSLADEALAAFQSADAIDIAEIRLLGTILHDLKNHLVAFHVALATPTAETTARLRAQYEASQHLDSAIALMQVARAVGRALDRAQVARLEVGQFFREYFAEQYATLPATIELVVPTRSEGGEVWTDRAYLRSILDNIVKNAVEAMPDGGRITCEWLVDVPGERLLIEVADTGPGIEPDILGRLLAGEPVDSQKPGGSGIGMLTVRSMVSRLGGTISGESAPTTGTRWSVELPAAEPTRLSEAASEADLQGAVA